LLGEKETGAGTMFVFSTWAIIRNAAKTADKVKPEVTVEAPGIYRVAGRNGTEFVVACYKSETGERIVDCGCVAGQKLHVPCFHSAAAVRTHVSLKTWSQQVF